MPIYEYRCENGHTFEVIQSMSDDPVTACEECGAPVQRVFNPVAIHFKGSGFHNTDYKNKGKGAAKEPASSSSDSGSSDSNSDSKSDSGSGSSETKTETKKSDSKSSESAAKTASSSD